MSNRIPLPNPRLIHITGCIECALLGSKMEPLTRQRLQHAPSPLRCQIPISRNGRRSCACMQLNLDKLEDLFQLLETMTTGLLNQQQIERPHRVADYPVRPRITNYVRIQEKEYSIRTRHF
jgi:hypothetical protein